MMIENLKIGFFGHSIAVRNSKFAKVEHFIDRIARSTNSKIVNDGSILCSEERILYELKKLKNDLDLAVIFHSDPAFYFTPKIPKRDFQLVNENDFDSKYKMIRNFDKKNPIHRAVSEQAHESFFQGTALNREDFITGLKYFNRYFFNHDLQINRHQGALVLIDQYLLYKKIPVVHSLPIHGGSIPSWFTFQTGVVENKIQNFQNNEFRENDHTISSNCINQEGNNIIADTLLSLMADAVIKIKDNN
jgi:hypothetical protein